MGFEDVIFQSAEADLMTMIGYSILLGCIVLVCWPFTIYCVYIFKRDYNASHFIKRKPSLIAFILINACISLFIIMPFNSVLNIYYKNTWLIPPELYYILTYINKACAFGVMFGFLLRVHLLYMDFGYNKAISNKEWTKIVNNDYINDNWFIKRRNTLGSSKYMVFYLVLSIIICTAIYIMIDLGSIMLNPEMYKHYKPSFIFAIIVLGAALVLLFVIWCKYPELNDHLGIKKELKSVIIWWFFCYILTEIIVTIMLFGKSSVTMNLSFGIFGTIAMNFTGVLFFMIYKVNKDYKIDINGKRSSYSVSTSNARTSQIQLATMFKNSRKVTSNEPNGERDSGLKRQRTWKDFIAKVDGYELFMAHLNLEFSMENLLYSTEYNQFKNCLKNVCGDVLEGLKINWDMKLDKKCPKSKIVIDFENELSTDNNNDRLNIIYDSFKKLYNKYIIGINGYGAILEINISSLQRNELHKLCKTCDNDSETDKSIDEIKAIIYAFEIAQKEVSKLINDAFYRFKKTNIAQEYYDKYINNTINDDITTPSDTVVGSADQLLQPHTLTIQHINSNSA